MKAFKLFFQLAKSNKLGIIINVTMMFVMVIIYVNYPTNQQTDFSNQTFNVSYHIENESNLTQGLKNHLKSYVREETIKESELNDAHYYQIVNLSIIIQGNLEVDLLNGNPQISIYSRNAEEFISAPVETEIQSYLNYYKALISVGKSEDEALLLASKLSDPQLNIEMVKPANEERVVLSLLFNFMSYVIMGMGLLIVVPVLIKIRQTKLQERTFISAYKKSSYYAGLFSASGIFMIGTTLIMFIAVLTLMNQWHAHTILLYGLNILGYLVTVIALSLLVGSIFKSDVSSNVFANVFGLGQAFISGVFIPKQFLGQGMNTAAKIMPANYFVNLNTLIANDNYTLNEVTPNFLMFLVFSVVFIGLLLLYHQVTRKKN